MSRALPLRDAAVLKGRGLGLGTQFVFYGATGAEVEVAEQTGEVQALRLCGPLDCGLVVNPKLVERQVHGLLMQAMTGCLNRPRVSWWPVG